MCNESLGGCTDVVFRQPTLIGYCDAVRCMTVRMAAYSRTIRLSSASVGVWLPYAGTEFPTDA